MAVTVDVDRQVLVTYTAHTAVVYEDVISSWIGFPELNPYAVSAHRVSDEPARYSGEPVIRRASEPDQPARPADWRPWG